MSKPKAPRRVGEKEALSVGTTIRGSAQKLNLVAALIRGRKAEEAMNILAFSKRAMAVDARKVLASAIANARFLADKTNEAFDERELVVSTAYVDEGPTMKRFQPRAQGRAYRINKRTCHITLVVSQPEKKGSAR